MVSFLAVIGALVATGAFLFGVPPIQRAVNYRLNALNPNAIPDVQTLIDLWWRGVIDSNEYHELMRKYGYDDEWASKLLEVGRQYISVSEMLELYRRGEIEKKDFIKYLHNHGIREEDASQILKLAERLLGAGDLVELLYRKKIDEETYYNEMKKLGITREKADYIRELYKFIPSPTDFIRFAVRDVFNEAIVKKYGYDEEFPEGIVPFAEMRGMDRQTLLWYWRAHWELPSPTAAFEMIHRLNPEVLNTPTSTGGKMIDKYGKMGLDTSNLETTIEDVRTLLKIADYPKYWRDRLAALAFQPLTRVDLRRIYELGLINEVELKARLMELGYSSEDADLMVEFYKAYKLSQEKDFNKSEILKLYKLRAIKREEALQMLQNLGYSIEEADYLLQLEDYKYYQEWIEERVKTLEIRYMRGLIDLQQLHDELNSLGLPAEEVAVYLEEAQRKKLQAEKMPSKEDLINMFKSGVLSVEEFKMYMQRLGYSEFWIDKYLKMLGVSA